MMRQLATASELTILLGNPATATVWLPSRNGQPQTRLGTYQLGVNALSGEAGADSLQRWQVTGMTLDPFHALAFLSRFTNQRLIEIPSSTALFRHARQGNDLLFWSHAAKFVLELLAGQHFLPGLIPDQSGRFRAAWQPFMMEGSLRERLEFLVAAMPPICRAYELESLEEAPSSGGLLEEFIAALMNGAIREWTPKIEPPEGNGLFASAEGVREGGARPAGHSPRLALGGGPVRRAPYAAAASATCPPALSAVDRMDGAAAHFCGGFQFPGGICFGTAA